MPPQLTDLAARERLFISYQDQQQLTGRLQRAGQAFAADQAAVWKALRPCAPGSGFVMETS